MDTLVSLNDFYLQYVAGLLSKKELEGLIFKSIQNNPRRFGLYRWRKMDLDEYLSWLYPRISKAIDNYRDFGLSFDNYMGGLIHLAVKEFRTRQADSQVCEHTAWIVWYSCECAQETEPEYSEEEEMAAGMAKCPGNPRQLLILILKCYRYISDEFLERIALLSGLNIDILKEMLEQIRKLRDQRDMEIILMRERVQAQFYRCIMYEKQLTTIPENSAVSERMKIRLEKARGRLANMRRRLAGMRLDPSSPQIAGVLGINKNTVDSSLYALKKRWNNVSKKAILN